MRDIHLPPEPGWWPPAPGWWLLALLLAWVGCALVRRGLRAWRARQRRRALLAEFEVAAALAEPRTRLAALSALLRRAACLRDPAAASLEGARWREYLQHRSAASGGITPADAALLADGLYRPMIDAQAVQGLLGPARRCYLALLAPDPGGSAAQR
ncbi:MAG: hypothetical protein AMXMBFR25_22400 [Lysobacterales bacterium]